jgi:hypothetical protein
MASQPIVNLPTISAPLSIPRQPVKRFKKDGKMCFGLLPKHANNYSEAEKQIIYRLVDDFAKRGAKVGQGNVIDFKLEGTDEVEFSIVLLKVTRDIYSIEKMLPHEVVVPTD